MTTTIDPAALAAERAVGIEEYATACEGFDAVLKHRYSDFVVNEIDGRGKAVVLRQVGHKSAAAADAAAAARAAAADSSAVEAALLTRGDASSSAPADSNPASSSSSLGGLLASLVALTSEEDAARVREFLGSLTTPSDGESDRGQTQDQQQQGQQRALVLSPSRDKASRGAVHAWFREAGRALGAGLAARGSLETTTTTIPKAASGAGAEAPASSSVCVVFTPRGSGGGGGKGGGRGGRGGGGRGGGSKRGRDDDGNDGGASAHPLNQTSRQRPPLPAAFCHFTLEKTNLDTAAALQEIAARCWGGGGGRGRGRGRGGGNQNRRPVSAAALAVAGTKDKRGVTSQRVSARRTAAPRIAAAAAGVRGVRVGDFSYESEGLRLGDARGNRFTIALRGLRAGKKDEGSGNGNGDGDGNETALVAAAAAAAFGARGFLNYFGRQRFGVGGGAAPTHVVGALLARGEWEAAARAIMSPRGARGGGGGGETRSGGGDCAPPPPPSAFPSRHEAEDAARRAWLRGELDPGRALAALPRGAVAERAVLASLAAAEAEDEAERARATKAPGAPPPPPTKEPFSAGARAARFSLALSRVPRNLRTMYIHALQSRLWNAAASARAREGLEAGVVEGDVISVDDREEGARDGDGGGGDDGGGDGDESDDDADAVDAAVSAAAEDDGEAEENDESDGAKERQQQQRQQGNYNCKKRLPLAVRLATAADAGLPISRVVLPMLAPGILLPANSAGDALRQAARELGVDVATCGAAAEENGNCGEGEVAATLAATRSHLGLAAAAGGYRRLLAAPSRVRHLFVAHAGADDDLPMGELFGEEEEEEEEEEEGGDKAGKKNKKAKKTFNASSLQSSVEPWVPGQPLPAGKKHVALLLRFRLPRSSYATMAVRELTKRPGWDSNSSWGAAGGAAAAAAVKEEADGRKQEAATAKEEATTAAAAASPPPLLPASAEAAPPPPTAE